MARGVRDNEAADEAVPAVDAEVVLVAKDRDHELGRGRLVGLAWASHGLRPRLSVQRASASICARFAGDKPSGTPPPLIVAFSPLVSRGRRAWMTVVSTICPPMAR